MRVSLRRLLLIPAAALAACSSGGGGTPSVPAVPVAPAAAPTSAPVTMPGSTAKQTGTLSFSIAVPGRAAGSAAHRRLPAYVSASTAKVSIVVQGAAESAPEAAQVFACTSVCTGSFAAPAGADRVSLSLLDASNKLLSEGVATVLVFAGQSNTFSFTLDGIVASVDLTVSTPTLPVVPAQTGYVLFNARDVDGNIITYDGKYVDANDAPLVFDLASSNATFTLGVTTISAPGTLIPFTYSGAGHVGSVALTPSAHSGTTTTATFTPATVKLIPALLKQVDAPLPVTVVGAMQIPFASGTSAFDSGGQYIVGNGPAGAVILNFTASSGSYATASLEPNPGIAGTPVISTMNGAAEISGDVAQGNGMWSPYAAFSTLLQRNTSAASPCYSSSDEPFGYIGQTLICGDVGLGGATFDYTGTFMQLASGTPRKIAGLGTATYFQTIAPSGLAVYSANAQIPNVTNFGYDTGNASLFYFAENDGTVHIAGSAGALATFSSPVTMVVGTSPKVFVMEGQSFGYFDGANVYETAPLAIGTPFELLVGPGGAPIILENDGRMDYIAL